MTINYSELNNIVLNENEMLEKTYTNLKDVYSTDNQLFTYNEQNVVWLKNVNSFLFFLYYLLLISFIIAIFLTNKYTKYTIFLVVLLLILPFIIVKTEIILWNKFKLFIYTIFGIPRTNHDFFPNSFSTEIKKWIGYV